MNFQTYNYSLLIMIVKYLLNVVSGSLSLFLHEIDHFFDFINHNL